jgi:transcriptional regulator with XRE-family HTH domain
MAELPDDLVMRLYAGASPVRLIREHRGQTQNELASRASMPPAEVRQIEKTKRFRHADQCDRLAGALGVLPCALRSVQGRYRGCDEAAESFDEEGA